MRPRSALVLHTAYATLRARRDQCIIAASLLPLTKLIKQDKKKNEELPAANLELLLTHIIHNKKNNKENRISEFSLRYFVYRLASCMLSKYCNQILAQVSSVSCRPIGMMKYAQC